MHDTRARADRDDIVVVIHGKAHPIQLLPFQPVATDDKTLKRFMGKHFTIYIMAVDQWLQFFSHLAFKETRYGCMIHVSRSDVKMKCCCNTLSLTVTYVRKSRRLPSPQPAMLCSMCPHGKSGWYPLSSADCGYVLSAGLHQFQRQRSMRDPVPSAICVQPHIFSVRAQPQSQVHLWSLLCQEMST